MKEKTVAELIERFEGDILYDAHSFRAKFERSAARKELERRGEAHVPKDITNHLRRQNSVRAELVLAWGTLFAAITPELDEGTNTRPEVSDAHRWMAVAAQIAG